MPLDVQFEAAFLITSIHTDDTSVTIQDFVHLQFSDGDFYFEPDFE